MRRSDCRKSLRRVGSRRWLGAGLAAVVGVSAAVLPVLGPAAAFAGQGSSRPVRVSQSGAGSRLTMVVPAQVSRHSLSSVTRQSSPGRQRAHAVALYTVWSRLMKVQVAGGARVHEVDQWLDDQLVRDFSSPRTYRFFEFLRAERKNIGEIAAHARRKEGQMLLVKGKDRDTRETKWYNMVAFGDRVLVGDAQRELGGGRYFEATATNGELFPGADKLRNVRFIEVMSGAERWTYDQAERLMQAIAEHTRPRDVASLREVGGLLLHLRQVDLFGRLLGRPESLLDDASHRAMVRDQVNHFSTLVEKLSLLPRAPGIGEPELQELRDLSARFAGWIEEVELTRTGR